MKLYYNGRDETVASRLNFPQAVEWDGIVYRNRTRTIAHARVLFPNPWTEGVAPVLQVVNIAHLIIVP